MHARYAQVQSLTKANVARISGIQSRKARGPIKANQSFKGCAQGPFKANQGKLVRWPDEVGTPAEVERLSSLLEIGG